MLYLALLRGINVGGQSMVKMADLRATFEGLGLKDVRTYINSGNVLFETRAKVRRRLVRRIEAAIEPLIGQPVAVLLRTREEMDALVRALPDDWVNDSSMRCDVWFLAPGVDEPSVVDRFPTKPEIEDVRYVDGAVIWRIDRANLSRSRMSKLVGTDVYKQMSARNANTVRKLHALMQDA
jgi:uncharacterized protein (DUF1697 family)